MKTESGVIECARYAYRPNRLKYCGPDRNAELFEIIGAGAEAEAADILKKFECLSPNLEFIAGKNKLALFDGRAVSAYWIGNNFLENTGGSALYSHLADRFAIEKKASFDEKNKTKGKILSGGNLHHSFYVFNMWQRAAKAEDPNILFMMDECRIGWGKAENVAEEIVKVWYEPVVYNNGRLAFGAPVLKNIFRELPGAIKIGDWVSFHWSSFCEVLAPEQVKKLSFWTKINLESANL